MSWNPALDPTIPIGDAVDAIEAVIVPRARDLGGFEVRRALPSVERQMVGPFIFFDQMGPAEFLTGQGIDVRPHPHIGLATVTYLLKGRLHHRDSLGTDQWIEPGAVKRLSVAVAVDGKYTPPASGDGEPTYAPVSEEDRAKIEALGGEYRFQHRVTDFEFDRGPDGGRRLRGLHLHTGEFLEADHNDFGGLMAGVTLASLPALAVFFLFQRKVMDTFVASGIKG